MRTREVTNRDPNGTTVHIEVKKTDPQHPHVINFEREALCKSLDEARSFLAMIDLFDKGVASLAFTELAHF